MKSRGAICSIERVEGSDPRGRKREKTSVFVGVERIGGVKDEEQKYGKKGEAKQRISPRSGAKGGGRREGDHLS